jgi:predicted alpha/beta superfamily hydrolase
MRLRLALGTSLATWALGSFSLCVSAQPVTVGEPIVVGQRFQLDSKSMGETRSYQVHRPPDYDISAARYPVLVVLDGESNFQLVSATVDLLASAGRIPAMLVVGIPNTDRYRDMDSSAAPGSSTFLEFITDELVPTIDRDYRTSPYRILVGHSGAGLFALYSMINKPGAFRGYVVIAPSFGDNRELPETIRAFLEEHEDPSLDADLFMTVDDATGMGLSGAWELSSYLQDRAARVRDLRFTFRHYPDESHTAVPLRSVYDGLPSIFAGWGLDRDDAFALYEQGGLAAIDKHFGALSARLGFPVAVPEEALHGTFGHLEGLKRFPEAEQVIKRAIEAFPESPAALYYAGRLYMQMGNTALAVDTLKKSLLLSPNYRASRSLLEYMKVDADQLVPEVRVSGDDVAKFVGGYGTSTVVFEIERRGDAIVGKTSEAEYQLDALSATTFSYSGTHSNGVVAFRTDDRNRVIGLAFQNGAELAKLR